jgi:Protein of unknown function (DUF3307)
MISIWNIVIVVLYHWFADFVMQRGVDGKNKGHSLKHLLIHTTIYSILWFIPMVFVLGYLKAFIFVIITFISHTITDYFTSKKTSKEYLNGNFGGDSLPRRFDFFVTIGFDQSLHYIQLFLTLLGLA